MKYLVIYAHPDVENSFNKLVFETVKQELKSKGHQVKDRDLYKLGFDPVLEASDMEDWASGVTPLDLEDEQHLISWADHLIFIYPVWWAYMPSILKGYFDRTFSEGFAVSEGKGLLGGKKGSVICSFGGNEEHVRGFGIKDAMELLVNRCIFEYCGMEATENLYFYEVPSADEKTKKSYLDEVREFISKQAKA